MALSSGLFHDQDQIEDDANNGPGWTIDQQKPSFFDNIAGSPFRGIGQGAADGIALLAHGVEYPYHALQSLGHITDLTDPNRAFGARSDDTQPWKPPEGAPDELERKAREYSKSLVPDPRVTGVGANLVQGVSKAVTEFAAGSAVAGPYGGAALLGTSEGYAHYHDLKDQGVDEDTAQRSALLQGALAGGGALLPMSFPAKWVSGLTVPGTYAAQAAAGAGINTAFGLASRYAQAKILRDAGYPAMADQAEPMDATSIAADAISGLFFGAHAAWHGLKAPDLDPSVRDAAKVVQDRVSADLRAPGVPVNMKSAATHREALETALGDLMTNKPVDLDADKMDGAMFARPEENTQEAREIMRSAFVESGVLDDAAEFDRWLAGEREDRPDVAAPKGKPTGFTTAKGSTYEIGENGVTTRNKMARPEHPGDEGPQPTSERTFYISAKDAETLGEFQAQGGPKKVIAERNGEAGVKYTEGKDAGKFEKRTMVKIKNEPELGAVPVELWKGGAQAHFGNEITVLSSREPREGESHQAPQTFRLYRGIADGKGVFRFPEAQGVYFSDSLEDAENYAGDGGKVVEADVQMHKPFVTDERMAYITADKRAELEGEGYDGIISKHGGINEYTVFDPRQVRPTDGSSGADTFPPKLRPDGPTNKNVYFEPPPQFETTEAKSETEGPKLDTAPALASRPDLEIATEAGEPASAAEQLAKATEAESQANAEAEPMHTAAVNCEARYS